MENDAIKLMADIKHKTDELNDLISKAAQKGLQVKVKFAKKTNQLDVQFIGPDGQPVLSPVLEAILTETYGKP